MSVDLVRLCDPDAHYDKFVEAGIYPDGRAINVFSTISFKNEQYGGIGSSVVRQGGVTASCTISAEMCLANDGPLLIPKIEGASDLSETAVNDILDILNEILNCEETIQRSALVCKGTEDSIPLSWRLTIIVRVLNSSGNVIDAVIGAVTFALAGLRLPHIKISHMREDEAPIEKDEISVLPEKSGISFIHLPVCSTFGIYKTTTLSEEKTFILCDPPAEMLSLCSTYCTVIAGREIILNLKLHGHISDKLLLDSIFTLAIGRQKLISQSIKALE